jgi:hypothetical protein
MPCWFTSWIASGSLCAIALPESKRSVLMASASWPSARISTPMRAREMIRERVCAGVKNARHKGKRLGRPNRVFDRQRAVELRRQGRSLPQIARELGIGLGTVLRALDGQKLSKMAPEPASPSA